MVKIKEIRKAWRLASVEVKDILVCERCKGTADDPEYDLGPRFEYEIGPCIDCGGEAFDLHHNDFRAMRLLGIA